MTDQTEAPAGIAPAASDISKPTVPGANKFETITLEEPIVRGETAITDLTLRKPSAGELRKLSLKDLINTDIDAILELLPRISDPILNDHEVNAICPGDLAQVGGVIRGFFLTPAERAAYQKMVES